ncbi:membrane protein, putative [hydrothermal vent metagenome]|uniref:Membrane protein, putative n=1 Tax=hydrothermal vent metagenome TaxID=652676 RepID=A0A3B0TAN9_9ZZZZ
MNAGAKTGRFVLWFTSLAVALVSWRFLLLGMEAAFPNMVHQLTPPRVMFYVHVLAGPAALAIMPFQLSANFRLCQPQWHRWLGRAYLAMVALGGVSGLVIGFNADGGPVAQAGFVLLSVVWLGVTARGFVLIRAGRIADHRAWMIRSAALAFAAVTLRLWLPVQLVAGVPYDIAYPVVAWICWVPNLLFAEVLLRRHAPATSPAPAQS